MKYKQIQIDIDIYKALEGLRQSFEESENDILRREFLPIAEEKCKNGGNQGGLFIKEGVYLQHGTRLRHVARRSGRQYQATIKDGGIEYESRLYHSPSKAAVAAAGNNRNGWTFWEYYDEDIGQWQLLDRLRND